MKRLESMDYGGVYGRTSVGVLYQVERIEVCKIIGEIDYLDKYDAVPIMTGEGSRILLWDYNLPQDL